jgi:hypothetical protein
MNVSFTTEHDGMTLRQILSGFLDGREVKNIVDIQDEKKANEVLDTPYIHNGPRFIASKYTSLNYQDVESFINPKNGLLFVDVCEFDSDSD